MLAGTYIHFTLKRCKIDTILSILGELALDIYGWHIPKKPNLFSTLPRSIKTEKWAISLLKWRISFQNLVCFFFQKKFFSKNSNVKFRDGSLRAWHKRVNGINMLNKFCGTLNNCLNLLYMLLHQHNADYFPVNGAVKVEICKWVFHYKIQRYQYCHWKIL